MQIIHIRLLGPVEVEKEGTVVHSFRTRKALAILGYLARQPGPVPRSDLANLFWPDQTEARGRRNLSRELNCLTNLLPNCFETGYHTVQFQPGGNYRVDTITFEALVSSSLPARQALSGPARQAAGEGEAGLQFDNLAQAITLYRGRFMSRHYLSDCPEFETWLLREQEHWRQRVIEIFSC